MTDQEYLTNNCLNGPMFGHTEIHTIIFLISKICSNVELTISLSFRLQLSFINYFVYLLCT